MRKSAACRQAAFNVIGDWIYYSNPDDSGTIYRITTDGLYNEKILDVPNACCISIAGGWISFYPV